MLDTSAYIDLGYLELEDLPELVELTAITMAELHQGVALANDGETRAARTEKLTAAIRDFDPLRFDAESAARYGTLVALTVAAGRQPRPRRLDLMIGAIASVHGLPLYTSNPNDFQGLGDALTVVPTAAATKR